MKADLAIEIQNAVSQIPILCWGFWIIGPLATVVYLTLTNFLRTLTVLVTTLRVLDNGRRLLVNNPKGLGVFTVCPIKLQCCSKKMGHLNYALGKSSLASLNSSSSLQHVITFFQFDA